MRSVCEKAIAYVQPAPPDEVLAGEESADAGNDDAPVFRPVADGLIVSYLIEDGEDYRYVQKSDIDQAGMTADELHRVGLRNLADLAKEKIIIQSQGWYFAATMGGSFEASVILLDALWDRGIRHVVSNDFVVAIPARDVLAFCDSETPEGLEELRAIVDRIWAIGDHLITRTLYRRRGSKWEPVREI